MYVQIGNSSTIKQVIANLFNKIENILIIDELYVTPINFFSCILFLFHLEDMLSSIANVTCSKFCFIRSNLSLICHPLETLIEYKP